MTAHAIDQEDVAEYVELVKARRNWYNFSAEPKTPRIFIKRIYTYLRPFLFFFCFCITVEACRRKEAFGVLDGSIIFLELWFHLTMMSAMFWLLQKEHEELVTLIAHVFQARDEPKMRAIRVGTLTPLTKLVKIVIKIDYVSTFVLVLSGLIADSILHYGWDALNKPFTLPSPFESFLGPFYTWNVAYYANFFLTSWFVWEVLDLHQTQVVGYLLLLTYCSIELRKFKESIMAMKRERKEEKIRMKLKKIISWHQDIVKLKIALKNFLGLPCAFNYFLTTINITLLSFSATMSQKIELTFAYSFGFICYFFIGLLFCWLGQVLEDKSSDVYDTITYELPWYRYSPSTRKMLNMMIRQAQYPITIEYSGGSAMNLASFKDMISSSYSCFTLLRTVTVGE